MSAVAWIPGRSAGTARTIRLGQTMPWVRVCDARSGGRHDARGAAGIASTSVCVHAG